MSSTSPSDPPQAERFAKRLIELYGGREAARESLARQYAVIAHKWNQNTEPLGRILRAHLFVEHYLTRLLVTRNPRLGSPGEARLTFQQKVALVGNVGPDLRELLPGLRRLNAVRNRLVHTLRASVSVEDADVFLSIAPFRALRDALAEPSVPSTVPLDILEDFARHAGITLEAASNPDRELWAEAVRYSLGDGTRSSHRGKNKR